MNHGATKRPDEGGEVPKNTVADRIVKPNPDMQISAADAIALTQRDSSVTLIDVRSEGERSLGRVKGSRFIAPGDIERAFSDPATDKAGQVLLYCSSSGSRSLRAAHRLREMGFDARSITGGYDAWLAAGGDVVTDGAFTIDRLGRYSRNMLLREIGEEGQLKLMSAKVLLVGAGGLASSAALYLAASGVETLGLVDFDIVELSNLNRQVIHGNGDVGRLKVDSAKAAIERINPDVRVILYPVRLTPENALRIIADFDIVLDACDNVDTKFLLNDACFFADKPYVFGGAVGFDGQASVFWPSTGGPCLRCLFPDPPPQHLVPT